MNTETFSSSSMKPLMATMAGLFTVILAFAVARERGMLDPDLARRVVAIGFGVMLVVLGNALPKLVRPLRMHDNDHAKVVAADRFAGRIFVLAGIVFVALWAFAPVEHVMRTSALVGLAAFGFVAASQLRLSLGRDPGRGHATTESDAATSGVALTRWVLIYFLHALLWVFAMFLADSIWGDRAAPWMVGSFVLASGALIFTHRRRQLDHQ